MKTTVITYPGSNCDDDTIYTMRETCGWETDSLWHKDEPDLSGYDLVVLPGGFSYGDYLRCGAIASLSPIMRSIKTYADGGGYVLGICNGFQVLCESGLLPGTLAPNASLRFSCMDVSLTVANSQSPWTCKLESGSKVVLPIAHGDGRYVITDAQYSALKENDQVLLTYDHNPNGSVFDIAGVCNQTKNVFGLMPHPERASDLRSTHGLGIWHSIKETIENA